MKKALFFSLFMRITKSKSDFRKAIGQLKSTNFENDNLNRNLFFICDMDT